MITKAEGLAQQAEAKVKSSEATLQATQALIQNQENTNRELVNMAQHILKGHASSKQQGMLILRGNSL